MTTRFGVFSEAPGIGLGDPFVDSAKPDARARALGFKASACKHGKVSVCHAAAGARPGSARRGP